MIIYNYNHLINILKLVLQFKVPTDVILKNYYKQNKSLGKNSRKFISDIIFLLLRNFEKIHNVLVTNNSVNLDSYLQCVYYIFNEFDKNIFSTKSIFQQKYLLNLQNLSQNINNQNLNIVAELPTWIIDKLKSYYNSDQIIQLGHLLNSNASLDLRVNILKTNKTDVMQQLQNQGINAEATKYSPWGIRIKNKTSILNNSLYTNGLIEIQDEGSQLISYFTKAKRNNLVIDLCAGAGGKTLAIGAMMQNKGRIYAFDTSQERLQNIKNRILKSGLNNVFISLIKNENDEKLLKLYNKADIVLIDTPCSGLGTLRRNPDLKYRQNNLSIERFTTIQKNLLIAGNNLVKKGGKLIYATCSILPEENELQIQNFLFHNKNYIIQDYSHLLNEINMKMKNNQLIYFNPLKYNMDGFFIAILEKIY